MGNVFLWTCSVILLCLDGITFGHRFPYENPSLGYRNPHSKFNLRNFLGSKLVQKLADNQNTAPHYEPFEEQMPNSFSREHQMVHSLPLPSPPQPLSPPPPPPPSFSRGVAQYEYQRVPYQTLPPALPPQSVGASLDMEPSYHRIRPPAQAVGPPLSPPLPSPSSPASLPPHVMIPPPLPPAPLPPPPPPPHAMIPPSHSMSQQNIQENMYTETVTSTCPCGTCSECEAAAQDYSYQDEPCSCCSEGGCPCACENCPCSSKGRGSNGGRSPSYSGDDASYPSEKEYYDREPNYDDYPTSDCPCCCECSGSQDCPCNCADEQPNPPRLMERPNYRGYSQASHMNENYMEGPPEVHVQRQNEHYVSMGGPPSYKPVSAPGREVQPPHYRQYEESIPIEPPQYVKAPPQRTFVPQPVPPPNVHHAQTPEFPEGDTCPHMPGPQERILPHMGVPEVPERTMHHTEITERTVHRYHEPAPPMSMPPVESCPMNQEMAGASEWRPARMPPPGPPRHYIEENSPHSEPIPPPLPPSQVYQRYRPVPRRYGRKFRQPYKPPFFEGLSYSDGC